MLFNETFKKAWKNGGSKILIQNILSSIAFFIVGLILFGSLIVELIANKGQFSLGLNVICLFIYSIIGSIAITIIQIGTVVSFRDTFEEECLQVSLKAVFKKGVENFWRYMGWSFLYGLIIALMVYLVMTLTFFIFPFIGICLCWLIIPMCILPSFYFKIMKIDCEMKVFINEKFKELIIFNVVFSVLYCIPLINVVTGLMQMIYPLFLLSLYYDNKEETY